MKKLFVLRGTEVKDRCIAYIQALSINYLWAVTVNEYADPKTAEQERKYHAMIGDITPYFEFMGRRDWSGEDVKRLLIDAFARIRNQEGRPLKQGGRVVPSIDGSGVVHLGVQSRQFTKEEASEFIEFLYAYGANLGVEWDH